MIAPAWDTDHGIGTWLGLCPNFRVRVGHRMDAAITHGVPGSERSQSPCRAVLGTPGETDDWMITRGT